MFRCFNIYLAWGPLGAASQPRPNPVPNAAGTWTNKDLERFNRIPSLISILGQPANETLQSVETLAPLPKSKDSAWYTSQAAALNAQREAEQTDLRRFAEALADTQQLKGTTGGINLAGGRRWHHARCDHRHPAKPCVGNGKQTRRPGRPCPQQRHRARNPARSNRRNRQLRSYREKG